MLTDYRVRQREYLLEISRAMTARLDLEAVLRLILDAACELLASNVGLIVLRREDGCRLIEGSGKGKEEAHFAAYGVVPNQEDPYAKTLQSLVDHAQELEQAVSALTEKMRRLEQAAERAKTDSLSAVK